MDTFGHQTLELRPTQPIGDVLALGPVKSTILDESGKMKARPPFAGPGYYFWEDNLDASEWWGKVHYSNRGLGYRVFRIKISFSHDDNCIFDLVGCVAHLKLLQKMIQKTSAKLPCTGWTLNQYIAYFRQINDSTGNGIFPFRMIRFLDSQTFKNAMAHKIPLSNSHNSIILNPFYIICVFKKEDLDLSSFVFIKQEETAQ